MRQVKSDTVEGVQYLRGIAALMVVLTHAYGESPLLPAILAAGSRGVDIFFVISGFIMAYSTQSAGRSRRSGTPLDFLGKRILRVVPLYWLATLWSDKRYILGGENLADVGKDLIFIPHFLRGERPLYTVMTQGWTLNYEMFFYALFALSMLFGRNRYVVLIFTLCLLVMSSTLPLHGALFEFATASVMIEFAYGIVIFFLVKSRPVELPNIALVAIGFLAMLALTWYPHNEWRGYLNGPFAALIVWCAVNLRFKRKNWLLDEIGAASYSIYLFHFAGFAVAGAMLSRLNFFAATSDAKVAELVILAGFGVVAGMLVHRVVEKPMVSYLNSKFGRRKNTAAVQVAL